MKHAVKGLHGTPSIMKLRQRQRVCLQVQYEHEIFSERAQLSREKTWLNEEKENWQERINRINNRLLNIEKLEETLIQKQMAMKEQISRNVEGGSRTPDRELREMIIKY